MEFVSEGGAGSSLKSWNSHGVTSLLCGVRGLEKLAGELGRLIVGARALLFDELVRFLGVGAAILESTVPLVPYVANGGRLVSEPCRPSLGSSSPKKL